MTDNYDAEVFDEKNIPESNWFKFEKVGDKVSGVVQEIFDKKGDEVFPDQKVFVLKTATGEDVNVGIKKNNTFVISRTNKVRPGDKVGFLFKEEIPASTKGYNPAKSIVPFVTYTPEGDVFRSNEKPF